MSFIDQSGPSAPDLYRTGLLASAIAYLGILLLVTLSMIVDSADPRLALSVFFMGGLYMAIPAVGIAFLISAPIGCAIGVFLRESFDPGPWQGAVNGALTALILIVLFVLVLESDALASPDPDTFLFVSAVIAVGALSGWQAQRISITWPDGTSDPCEEDED